MATTSQSPPIKGGVDGARTSGVVERVAELLEVTYRSADLGNVEDVLTENIYILLSLIPASGFTSEYSGSSGRPTRTGQEVTRGPERELRALLRPAGLQEQRARKIKQLLARVLEDNLQREVGPAVGADLTLDYLRDLSESASASFLLSLPGIGPKSANCILAYSLNHPRFAVDTHVERIFRRLGLVSSRRSPNSKVNHTEFESLVPPASANSCTSTSSITGGLYARTAPGNARPVSSCHSATRVSRHPLHQPVRPRLRSISSQGQEVWGRGSGRRVSGSPSPSNGIGMLPRPTEPTIPACPCWKRTLHRSPARG